MATTENFEEPKEEVHYDEVCTSSSPPNLSEESVPQTSVNNCDVTPSQQNSFTNYENETIQGLKQRVKELEELLQESTRTIEALNSVLYSNHSIDGNVIDEYQVSGSDVLYSESQEQDQFSSPTLASFTSRLDGSNYSGGKNLGPVNQLTEEYEDRLHEDELTSMNQQPTCDSPLPDSLDGCCTPPYSESYELEEDFSCRMEVETPMFDSVSTVQRDPYPPKTETSKALASRISRSPIQDFRESAARKRASHRGSQPPQSSWRRFSKTSFKECYRMAALASLRSSNFAMRPSASFSSRDRPSHAPRPRHLYQDKREVIHMPSRKSDYPTRQCNMAARISKPTDDRTSRSVYRREQTYAQKRSREYSHGTSQDVRHYDEGRSAHQPHSQQRRRDYHGKRA